MTLRKLLRVPCLAVTVLVVGCNPVMLKQERFGFVSSCPSGDWESCRRTNNKLSKQTIESFQKMLNETFDDAYEVSSLQATTTRDDFELLIVRDPFKAFLFESYISDRGGRKVHVVRTSSETFATISKITIARHLYGLPRFEQKWLAQYLLYIRKTRDGETILDPLRASGLISMANGRATPGAPDFTEAIKQGINDAYTVITFMTAHELYHLERPFRCVGPGAECEKRRREHEALADLYAIDILQKTAVKDPAPDYRLSIPTYVFMQFMLTMEGANGRSPIAPTQHPPNHERVRAAAIALDGWVQANPQSSSAASLRELSKYALDIVRQIDSETPTNYFADIDEESSRVTLASLRLY